MAEEILNFLKKNDNYISGEEISRNLKMSRAAIWKHIQHLRQIGYEIVAVPHLGYRLLSAPDKLLAGEVQYQLQTKFIGKKIYYFETVSSTMDTAFQLGIKGAPEGALILAETQTKGRGRLGRNWYSPKYKGIYLSLILRPQILPQRAPVLTLLAAVSVCEAIEAHSGLMAQIKWPNDILLNQKKFAGILTEISAETDAIHFVVIGIGLNINNEKKNLPENATSLREQKKQETGRVGLLQELLRNFEKNYLLFCSKTATPIVEKWRSFSVTLGKRVKILTQKRHLEGVAVDIDDDGGLLLRRDSGLIEKIMAGDVSHCR